MSDFSNLSGVYAAALTPLQPDGSPGLESVPLLLRFLAQRGCHGALLLGTTGEGPSFAQHESQGIIQAALEVRREYEHFHLLVGTGTPSLEETVSRTRAAFEAGLDGVVVLPPYYFRKVSDEGLFTWYAHVLQRAVPEGKALLGYHIPPVSGVPLSFDLLARLKDNFPTRFAGIKDSSADPQHARRLGERFGKDLFVLNGNDRLFSLALDSGASGCITALANLFSPLLRNIWDAFQAGSRDIEAQERLNAAREVLDRYPPAAPALKALLARAHGFPHWPVRPPLLPLPSPGIEQAVTEMYPALNKNVQ